MEERKRLEAAVQKEMKGKGHVDSSAASAAMESADAAADAQEDAMDAFMSNVQHQIEEDKVLHHKHPPRNSSHVGDHVYRWQVPWQIPAGWKLSLQHSMDRRIPECLHERCAAPNPQGSCFLQLELSMYCCCPYKM